MTISSSTTECDCCDFAAASFQCSRHPLMGGKNLMAQLVKEMHQASLMGHLWGDSMYELEQAELAAETPAQLSARLEKQEAAEEAGAQQLKEYELQKRENINIDPKTGKPKRCSGQVCKYLETPAKWTIGKVKQPHYKEWTATDPKFIAKTEKDWPKRPEGVPNNAVFWSYGCDPHRRKPGSCEHLHPGQPGYEAAKAAKAAKEAAKKHAGAEQIIANAYILSSKPAPKPSPLSKPVQVMQDSWYPN